jgi:hypothetical protein
LWRRYRSKEGLGKAHREHAFQRVVLSGFSHKKTVLCAGIINLSLLLLTLFLLYHQKIIIMGVVVTIPVLYAILKTIDKKMPFGSKEFNNSIDRKE